MNIEEHNVKKFDIKKDNGFIYLNFIITLGFRFKDFYNDPFKKLKRYVDELENGSGFGIGNKQKQILLSGTNRDIGISESLEDLLIRMTERMEQGVTESDYEVLNRFTKLFLKESNEYGIGAEDVIDGLLELIDLIELKGRLFINCCFIKKFETKLENLDYSDLLSKNTILVEEFYQRVKNIKDRTQNILDKLLDELNYLSDETKEFDTLNRAITLIRSSSEINNQLSILDFSEEGLVKLPGMFRELIDEWDQENEMQCKIVSRILRDIRL